MKRPIVAALGTIAVLALTGLIAAAGKAKPSPSVVLRKTVEHHAVKTSLAVALADFAVQTGLEVSVDWKTLNAAGIERTTKVALDVKNVTWRQVLDVILSRAYVRGAPLAWRTDGKTILISTQKSILRLAAKNAETILRSKTARPPKRNNRAKLLSSVEFTDMPLRDVLKFFETAVDSNFHVNWKALEQAGIGKETPISLNLRRISVGRALDLTLSQVNASQDKLERVYWIIDRGVVMVSTGADFNRTMVTRVIDAGTSLMVVPDSEGPRISLREASKAAGGANGGGGNDIKLFEDDEQRGSGETKSYDKQKKKQQDAVLESIKTMIGKDMWEPDGKGSIRIIGNKLVITQSLLGFKLMEKAMR